MSSSRPFVHLHCHTHFSLLDGANRIPDLVKKTRESGMEALAMTDHGNLYGAIEFYNTCRDEGIKPIIGYEAYVAPHSRTDRSASKMKEAQSHLTLLAMNRTGFQNLVHMASLAYLEGFHYKPRIDRSLLEQHSEGVICLSGCASSELSKLILAERMDEARKLCEWYTKVFGDRFYMEIQNAGLEIQRLCLEGTVDLARDLGLPLVATNDAHYLNQDDAGAHDVLLCVNTRSFLNDSKRMRMDCDQFFVRTPEEMYGAFPDFEEAVRETAHIADRVDIELDLDAKHYPVFQPPEQKSDTEYLRELCDKGLTWRYGDDITQAHHDRLEFELGVIEKMGYSSYFLIVWDFVRFAQEKHIPCQARGSACGALVAYLLGLSNVCPLEYDLLFERFLDPSRTEPPDIDIDFCRDRRQMVIDYTKKKYGERNVAQIGTFGTLKAKAAIRDVGRALSVPLPRVDEVCKMVPDTLNIKIGAALKESAELKEAYDQDPQVKEMIDMAMRLEGLARSAGTHAAGVVVSSKPLETLVPLQTITGKEDVLTQWDGPTVEMVGLLKMDFLGLRNLTILDKAVENVKKHNPECQDMDPLKFPLDDQETFALLQRGETKGIFQLESGGMRDLLTKMRPDAFHDIIATSALYRPGPLEGGMVMDYVNVKHGRQEINRIHPIVDEVLEETYGVMVYQEQVMRILNRVGGIELPAAYRCIKAISKKKLKIIAEFREQYINGAKEQGLDESVAGDLFELIEKFAGYGFNKCVVAETRITDSRTGRETTVGELFRTGPDNFRIQALGDDGQFHHRRIEDVVWNGRKPVFRVTTAAGRTLVATGNHPLLTPEGWRHIDRLAPGSLVAVPGITLPTISELAVSDRRVSQNMTEPASVSFSSIYSDSLRMEGQGRTSAVALETPQIEWDTVRSIEPAGIEDTYDLTVEIDHNFVANDLVVHNSHSTAYGAVAYQTAYLKAHYPTEFMAALLSCGMESSDRISEHIDDARRMKIEILPPDVNRSEFEFGIDDGRITFGMGAIKGVGEHALLAIVEAREADGPFKNIYDLTERVDPKLLNRSTLELLIKAGALDNFGPNRAQHMQAAERAIQSAVSKHRDRARGQMSLFGDEEEEDSVTEDVDLSLPEAPDWTHSQKLAAEKEVFGFYLTSHPLTEFADRLEKYSTHRNRELTELEDRTDVMLAGMVSSIKKAATKKPSRNGHTRYVNFDFEDSSGIVRCIMWPEEFAHFGERIEPELICLLKGRVDRRGREPNVIVNKIMTLDEAEKEFTEQVAIKFQRGLHTEQDMARVRDVLRRYPGNTDVILVVDSSTNGTDNRPVRYILTAANEFKVACKPELREELEEVLGDEHLQYHGGSRRRSSQGSIGR